MPRKGGGLLASEVVVGSTYLARVGGRIVPVTVLRATTREVVLRGRHWYRDAWECVNDLTGRTIVVRSAQRFREEIKRQAPAPTPAPAPEKQAHVDKTPPLQWPWPA